MSEFSNTSVPTLRNAISSAFYFVRSFEENKATYALTLDHLIEGQIQMLGDPDSNDRDRPITDAGGAIRRSSRYDRLGSMLEVLKAAVKAVKDAGDDEEALKRLGLYEVDATGEQDLRFEDPARAYSEPLESEA